MQIRQIRVFTVLFIFSFGVLQAGAAQANTNAQQQLQQVESLIQERQYPAALTILNQYLPADSPYAPEWQFWKGLCYYHLNKLSLAEETFQALATAKDFEIEESWYFLGKVFLAKHEFSKAGSCFKNFLYYLEPNDPYRDMVRDEIERCAFGIQILLSRSSIIMENLGPRVNTTFDEFAPVLDQKNTGILYFSSTRPGIAADRMKNGSCSSDIFQCSFDGQRWYGAAPAPVLATSKHEVLVGIDQFSNFLIAEGNRLGEGVVISYNKERKIREQLLAPLVPHYGDVALQLVGDTLLYFASKRPGGFGGLDLYETKLIGGTWSAPKNLGARINTAYDDTFPCLAPDGKTLFFSSNAPIHSMGGFDILKAELDEATGNWNEPKNLGRPVNSSSDEGYMRISPDGIRAYFSSNRKDGFGGWDLFVAYLKDPIQEKRRAEDMEEKVEALREHFGLNEEPETTKREVVNSQTFPDSPIWLKQMAPINTQDWVKIDQLGILLFEHPELKLIIAGEGKRVEARLSNRLHEGLHIAEKYKRYFIDKGIPETSIWVQGSMVYAPGGQGPEQMGDGLVSFALVNLEKVEEGALSSEVYRLELPTKKLVYKIQVASTQKIYKREELNLFASPMVEFKPGQAWYRYTVGEAPTFNEALQLQAQVRAAGFNGAYVVPYIKGIRVEKEDVPLLLDSFPDLQYFLEN